jgi:hypothetical protein
MTTWLWPPGSLSKYRESGKAADADIVAVPHRRHDGQQEWRINATDSA